MYTFRYYFLGYYDVEFLSSIIKFDICVVFNEQLCINAATYHKTVGFQKIEFLPNIIITINYIETDVEYKIAVIRKSI